MKLIDTHTHLYLERFDADRQAVVERALRAGVVRQLMPNIDSSSVAPMMKAARSFPGVCLPMMALHPTSVKENYSEELDRLEAYFEAENFVAVGETGIDLYWDTSFEAEQKEALARHISWAEKHDLPLVLHSRKSLDVIFDVLEAHSGRSLTGVFHCFPGNAGQARKVLDMGFMLGIGGVVTYKNSEMAEVVRAVGLDHLVLETDAPYLAPVPHRGKRNESAFLVHVAERVAALTGVTPAEVAAITTENARKLFKLPSRE
ncbi:MAG: TatD family hydrolase [Bacteroidales bacterium]|nr:TatD family hydrolase [Bacteroidales bacterium]